MKKSVAVLVMLAFAVLLVAQVSSEENLSDINSTLSINDTNTSLSTNVSDQNTSQNTSENIVASPIIKKCTPNCQNVECGADDGCGNQCWSCTENQYCDIANRKCKTPFTIPWLWIGAALILGVSGYLYYYFRKKEKDKEKEKLRNQWPSQPPFRPPYYPGRMPPQMQNNPNTRNFIYPPR
jgi:hypothetical protein